MRVQFKLAEHAVLDAQMVEIWIDDKMVGCIYPTSTTAIKLVSKHLVDILVQPGSQIVVARPGPDEVNTVWLSFNELRNAQEKVQ